MNTRAIIFLIAFCLSACGKQNDECWTNLFGTLDTCGLGYSCGVATSCVSLACEGICYRRCTTDADCPKGETCAEAVTSTTDRVCWD